jgi:hypothetical protein
MFDEPSECSPAFDLSRKFILTIGIKPFSAPLTSNSRDAMKNMEAGRFKQGETEVRMV